MSNIRTDVTLGEDRLNLHNIEKDIVIDINGIVDFSKQPYVNSYLQQCEHQDMVMYGMLMAYIDSLFPDKDTIISILNSLQEYELSFHVDIYFPSKGKVKSAVLFFINIFNLNGEDITLEKLEQNEDYLRSKMLTELAICAIALHESAIFIMEGVPMIASGVAKFIAGASGACLLVAIPGDEVITIPLTAVGATEAVAGVAVAGAGVGIALSVGSNAGNSAWDDYGKLNKLTQLGLPEKRIIDSKVMKTLKKMGLDKKFQNAMDKGLAPRRSGTSGIIKLTEKEIITKGGIEYTYKIKVATAGDHTRVYGYVNDAGELIFDYLIKGQ